MKDHALAMRYSKALFELAARENLELKAEAGLQAFKSVLQKDVGLNYFFENPMLAIEKKTVMIDQIAKSAVVPIPNLVTHFLTLVIARGRFALLDVILETYHELLNESQHFEEVTITTARQLRPDLQKKLEKLLEERIGEKIIAESRVDPSLIGGIQVQIRNRLFDGSIKSKLESLNSQLLAA